MLDTPTKLRVLIVGSGYVAQHLIAHLKDDFEVAYSHRRRAPPFEIPNVKSIYLDLEDDDSIATTLHETLPDVVVNCAAISSPAKCERDEARAMSANCPLNFLEALHACVPDVLLIHFSTDLVLPDGEKPVSDGGVGVKSASRCIAETPVPSNVYGRSKLAFEKALAEGWDRCVIFRMSNVAGPLAPYDQQGKFAQWVSNTLRDKGTVELWRDEVRSFVAMRQVRDGVKAAIQKYGVRHEPADDHEARALEAAALSPSETARFHNRARALRPPVFLHLNLGGPAPLSRVQFGRAVASAAALDADLVRGALRPAGTAPLSVALDSSSFVEALGVPLVPLDLALREAFASST
jgi:dTDP-4-dehydrorhamnose reductase